MPPRPKFSREKIIKIACKIVKKEGIEAITARNLGDKLGSSARPIFTVFRNMNEVKWEVRNAALRDFKKYLIESEDLIPAFKDIAVKTVMYSLVEPQLFKALFVWDDLEETDSQKTVCNLSGVEEIYIKSIQNDYRITSEEAKELFEQIWIQIFGMATLSTGNMVDFSESEIEKKISQAIRGIELTMNLAVGEKEYEEITEEFLGHIFEEVAEESEPKEEVKPKPKKEMIFSWLD